MKRKFSVKYDNDDSRAQSYEYGMSRPSKKGEQDRRPEEIHSRASKA